MREKQNLDDRVKSFVNRHPGGSRDPGKIEKLDSGFRRNDEFYGTFTGSPIFPRKINKEGEK